MELGKDSSIGKSENNLLDGWQQIFKESVGSQATGQQDINYHLGLSNKRILKKI